MRIYRASIVFCFCTILCHAQTTKADQALLSQMREKYDVPFARNLQSFNCAVDFSWKQHFTETTRVGDEGTDQELENIFQPIRNRVMVTRENITVSAAGLTDDEIEKLPHGGMAEFLLQHALQKGLASWLPTFTTSMIPSPDTPVTFKQSRSGYKLTYKLRTFDVEMVLDPDMRVQSATTSKEGQSDRTETSFAPGQQGFLLTKLTMGEDGDFNRGNRLIYTYTYQTVDDVELPEHVVVIRESHHEVWRYTLNDCSVKTGN